MDILFISRRSSHSKYFVRLSNAINITSNVYIMGKIKLSCLKLWHLRKSPALPYVVKKQLNRKIASEARIFRYPLVCFIYQFLLLKIEQYRFIHYVNLFQKASPKRIALWNG